MRKAMRGLVAVTLTFLAKPNKDDIWIDKVSFYGMFIIQTGI
jgi:hypothetical protein